jgi:hypothetical protein
LPKDLYYRFYDIQHFDLLALNSSNIALVPSSEVLYNY